MHSEQQGTFTKVKKNRNSKIIIHLGFPKTGTTTIQEFFSANEFCFDDNLIISAKDKLTKEVRKWALRSARWKSPRIARTFYKIALKNLISKISHLKFNTLVISDENLVGFQPANLLSPKNSFLTENIEALCKTFSGHNVEYVLYTRNSPAWLRSLYNQDFRMRRTIQNYEDWAKNHLSANSCTIAEKLKPAFRSNKLHIVSMESEVSSGLPLGSTLLRLAGYDDEFISKLKVPMKKNESLPDSSIELLKKIHALPSLRGRTYHSLVRIFASYPELFRPNS